jgi:hypothetical protein
MESANNVRMDAKSVVIILLMVILVQSVHQVIHIMRIIVIAPAVKDFVLHVKK